MTIGAQPLPGRYLIRRLGADRTDDVGSRRLDVDLCREEEDGSGSHSASLPQEAPGCPSPRPSTTRPAASGEA